MADKRESDPSISRFFKSRDGGEAPGTAASAVKRKKHPTGLRINDEYYGDIKILRWKLLHRHLTQTIDLALLEFIQNHAAELAEAKEQLGPDGIAKILRNEL